MSDIIDSGEDFVEESADPVEAAGDAVGLTSDEAAEQKKSLFSSLTVFDLMLFLALVFVTLATLRLFFELRTFGDFPASFPWRTNEFLSQ